MGLGRQRLGPVERDFNNGARAEPDPDRAIQSIRGTTYEKGLGTHAPAEIVYDVGGQCTQLVGYVGIDDSQSGRGRVDFVVEIDGEKAFDLERTGTDPAGRLNLDIRGAETLTLRSEPGPEGNGNDHADWADLRINCTDDFVAQPLSLSPEGGTDLSLLAPGMPVSLAVEGASPRTPVTVRFGDLETVVNADDDGRAVATFVVPADAEPGTTEISATAEAPFGTTATGSIAATVVAVSETTYRVDCSADGAGDGSEASPFTSRAQRDAGGAGRDDPLAARDRRILVGGARRVPRRLPRRGRPRGDRPARGPRDQPAERHRATGPAGA